MPAAAVIPAPIAYINVVAVKKLVVGFWDGPDCSTFGAIGGIRISLSEVKFLDLRKTNYCESICQECFH